MTKSKYQDIYPSKPLLNSAEIPRGSAAELLTLEYFEAEPASMPERVFDQHHVLLNLKEEPHRVENWRDGKHRDFIYQQYEIVVTPAGIRSGWRWHEKSNAIVVTLEPDSFEKFARDEVGILLRESQLRDLPLFHDEDICSAGKMLKESLENKEQGSEILFESLARVFLVKLIQKYGLKEEEYAFTKRFSAKQFRKVLGYVSENYGRTIAVEELASEASLSISHFARLFKQTIGLSPIQFVTNYRVEQAKKRLANSQVALAEISDSCGFADQAHFSRVFKQLVGETPAKFRAKIFA